MFTSPVTPLKAMTPARLRRRIVSLPESSPFHVASFKLLASAICRQPHGLEFDNIGQCHHNREWNQLCFPSVAISPLHSRSVRRIRFCGIVGNDRQRPFHSPVGECYPDDKFNGPSRKSGEAGGKQNVDHDDRIEFGSAILMVIRHRLCAGHGCN